jgi:hypothetical protein
LASVDANAAAPWPCCSRADCGYCDPDGLPSGTTSVVPGPRPPPPPVANVPRALEPALICYDPLRRSQLLTFSFRGGKHNHTDRQPSTTQSTTHTTLQYSHTYIHLRFTSTPAPPQQQHTHAWATPGPRLGHAWATPGLWIQEKTPCFRTSNFDTWSCTVKIELSTWCCIVKSGAFISIR